MDTDLISPPAYETPKHSTPWGLFIGLLLILVIIVSGAYYALVKRIGVSPLSPTNSETRSY